MQGCCCCSLHSFSPKDEMRVLLEATSVLNDLYLIAVRILDEKEARHGLALLFEANQLPRGETCGGETLVLGFDIRHHEGSMPIAVTQHIGFGAALVDG